MENGAQLLGIRTPTPPGIAGSPYVRAGAVYRVMLTRTEVLSGLAVNSLAALRSLPQGLDGHEAGARWVCGRMRELPRPSGPVGSIQVPTGGIRRSPVSRETLQAYTR